MWWEGYSAEEATWQPLSDFVNKGFINIKWYKYCTKHKSKLWKAILQARSVRELQMQKMMKKAEQPEVCV